MNRNRLRWVIGLALSALFLSACGAPVTTPVAVVNTPIPPTAAPSIEPTATATPTLTPTPSPTRTPTPTPAPPSPGEWTVSAKPLGEFVFKVSPDSTAITLASVTFTQFQCKGYGLDGKWLPDAHTGDIRNGQFALKGQIKGYMELNLTFPPGVGGLFQFPDVTISGKFDETGVSANGAWKAEWEGTSCSGTWKSSQAKPASPAEVPSGEPYYLYAFCNCQEKVPAGQAPALRWAWLTTTEAHTTDFINANKTTVTIDGVPYTGLEGYWGEVAFSADDQGYKSVWIYRLPPLSPGAHRVEISISLDRAVTDGYDSDGDGKLDRFGPGEVFYGWVDVSLTSATGQTSAACPNGAPAGHWALTAIKSSPGDGAITIDGEPVPIKSGENVIYLSAGQSHAILVGTTTVNFSAPECGENTLNVP